MLSVMRASAGCDMSTQTRLWLVEAARSLVAGQLWNSSVRTSSFTLILFFLSVSAFQLIPHDAQLAMRM